jgi:hypothetical protein
MAPVQARTLLKLANRPRFSVGVGVGVGVGVLIAVEAPEMRAFFPACVLLLEGIDF